MMKTNESQEIVSATLKIREALNVDQRRTIVKNLITNNKAGILCVENYLLP